MSRVDSARIYLDTSVIAAAMAADWPESDTCRKLLRSVGAGHTLAVTSSETLRELLIILEEHDEEAAALVATPALETLLGPFVQIGASDALGASELLGSAPGISPRLAVHVSVAARLGCAAVVTLSRTDGISLPVPCISPDAWQAETTRNNP